MTLRMVACQPKTLPEEIHMEEAIGDVTNFLNGYFQVVAIGEKLLLYALEYPLSQPFNRMFRGKPMYGNSLISKLGRVGKRASLSDQEITSLITELIVPIKNETN